MHAPATRPTRLRASPGALLYHARLSRTALKFPQLPLFPKLADADKVAVVAVILPPKRPTHCTVL